MLEITTTDSEIVKISNVTSHWFNRLPRKKKVLALLERIRNRECVVCINRKTMNCPNTVLCMRTDEKPYFKIKDSYEV